MGTDIEASLLAAGRQHAERAVKVVEDLERYERILAESDADVVIETGTFSGYSALWFARHVDLVITIDSTPQVAADLGLLSHGVYRIIGDSKDERVRRMVAGLIRREDRVLVSLDSDHSADHVYAEMCAYAPFVKHGGFMVVEDTLVRWMTGEPYAGSPLDAVERFLPAHPEWVHAGEIEDMFPVTQHPQGWLRRT